jgi:hypothetical protein
MVQGTKRARQNGKNKRKKRYVIKFLELDLNCCFKLIVLIFICQKFHSNQSKINILQPI